MSPLLRRLGFVLAFATVTMALQTQLSACPGVQLATEISDAQIVFEKSARSRISRAVELRRLPRPVAATLA
ncbi:MAG: hypothetical protein DI537_12190 [Stutzerimonas stutzeri]|jgi:hypothetical protein|uniref:Uncharacterized protein n=1 Tax=Bosea eneae TaxID=151454 RepID=A0ABW0ILZ9_9HYPH|nr:MAG: hypothetical protein DI537_12190 [Stutzerimonas stutzeri]